MLSQERSAGLHARYLSGGFDWWQAASCRRTERSCIMKWATLGCAEHACHAGGRIRAEAQKAAITQWDVVFANHLKMLRTGMQSRTDTQRTTQPGRQRRQGLSSLFPWFLLSDGSMLLGWATSLLVLSIPKWPVSPCRYQEPRGLPATEPYPLELSVRHE